MNFIQVSTLEAFLDNDEEVFNLHLKKLEIQGFKSFAEKTEIEFKDGITAIVGPNGSGKSNISDAIRWVLGEQSVKTLRGNKMEDVIFAGTDKRKPLGFSEVIITLDNSDGLMPVDYSEVSISRRMFRSGESEYYINKNSCRLKDIRELFMDTGVGKDGYSIIGQGRVDEILSTRSEDRRNIFEEAAGIVKYKSRKEEGIKRLEKTKENLVRIDDILFELEGQLEPLERQSNNAKKYLNLLNKLKDLEVSLFISEIIRLEREMDSIQKEKNNYTDNIEIYLKEKKDVESNYTYIKNQIVELDNVIEELQGKKHFLQSDIERDENKITLYDQNEVFHKREEDRLKMEIKSLKDSFSRLSTEESGILEGLGKLVEELTHLKDEYLKVELELDELNEEILNNEKTIDTEKSNAIELFNDISEKKNKNNSLNTFKKSIDSRIMELNKEILDLETENERRENEKSQLSINLVQLKQDYNKVENEITEYVQKRSQIIDESNKLSNKIDQHKGDLQGKTSNYNLLKNMDEDYEGYYKSVRSILLASKNEPKVNESIVGVVGDLIKVEDFYDKAIEIALGSGIQNIVTKTEEDAKYIIEYLKKYNMGRVTFLPISSIKGRKININIESIRKMGAIGVASELVQFDEIYREIFEYLLGRTLIVKDMDSGIAIAKMYSHSFKVVTLDGDVLNPGGSITGGSMLKNSPKILSRKNKIEVLKTEVDDLRRDLNEYEKKLMIIEKKKDKIDNFIDESEKKIQSIKIDTIKLDNEISKITSDIEKNKGLIQKYVDEITKLKEEKDDIEEEMNLLNLKIDQLEEGMEAASSSIREMVENFENKKQLKEQLSTKVTELKIKINKFENNISNKRERIESIKIERKNIEKNIEAKKTECVENFNKIKEVTDKREKTKIEIERKNVILYESLDLLKKKKDEKELFMGNFYREQKKLIEISEKVNDLEKKANNLDLRCTRNSVQIENYKGRLLDDYELVYQRGLKPNINLEDLKEVQKEIKGLKEKIKELGIINLGAIEEYKRIKEKYDFMTDQREDLINAKSSIDKLIKEMEEKMEEQFMENFNVIRSNFVVVFKELFGGGEADVYLIDEDNILNSGIEIIAQPPGKKLQSLSLLSGGEKSLTAVALLFAILKTRPTPFCILDEIDAALDEANISRYTSYLKKFSTETQFIIITHRKGTMEIADVLYGVTMEEEGVSELVSVKLSEKYSEKAS